MKNTFSVRGKTAVVTGGNKGRGFGIAEAFAASGANIAITSRALYPRPLAPPRYETS